jgi:hypothetical protein
MVMSGDPAVAFGMTIGAGLCTTLGAALAFCVNLEVCQKQKNGKKSTGVETEIADSMHTTTHIHSMRRKCSCIAYTFLTIVAGCFPQNKRFLAVSLACAAGVMVYVSMIEIFNKSLGALSAEWCPDLEAGETCPKAYGATTAFFFAGLALCALLNVFTHNLEDLIEFCRGGCVWKKSRGVKGGAGGGAAGVERGDAMKGCATETANSSGDENVQANSETRLVSEDDDADLERGLPLPHGWHVEMTPTLRPIFCNNEMKKRQFECPRVGVVDDLNSIGIELSSDHVQRPSEHAMSAMAGVPNSICACDNENCGVDKQADKKATGDEAQLTGSPPVDEAHAYKLKMTGLITGIAIVRTYTHSRHSHHWTCATAGCTIITASSQFFLLRRAGEAVPLQMVHGLAANQRLVHTKYASGYVVFLTGARVFDAGHSQLSGGPCDICVGHGGP